MKNIKELYNREKYTNRILQFGEGNFLRCFLDWQIDRINEKTDFDGGIVVVRPIDTEFPPLLNEQDGLYTTVIRGINEEGEVVKDYRVIKSVNRELPIYKEYDEFLELAGEESLRFIFSNTTEAGIIFDSADKFEDAPAKTFPAKLTRFLFERYKKFDGAEDKGFVIIPCELIDYNGDKLKEIILKYIELWKLEDEFKNWIESANTFCSTLVDRIVTGYPGDEMSAIEEEMGYKDSFVTTGEYFYLFVIQGPRWLEDELRLKELDLNIKIVEDIKPYKTRKVGLLNGAHTAMVPVAYLYGLDYVKESVEDEVAGKFIREALHEEIIPAIDMDKKELEDFAKAVISRFRNPYIKHKLIAISLNSMSKYRTRVLPQLLGYYEKKGELPKRLVFSLASIIRFYKGERGEEIIDLRDDKDILDLYEGLWGGYKKGEVSLGEIVEAVLAYEKNWECDLNKVPGLAEKVTEYLTLIEEKGMKYALFNIEK